MNFMNLPIALRALTIVGCTTSSLALVAPALAQEADSSPTGTSSAEIERPEGASDYIERRKYADADRVTFAILAAAVPGSSQLIQGRMLEGGLHLGGAVVLGSIGLFGWASDIEAAKWVSAIGLLGLSIYSPIDAYYANPPRKDGRRP